MENGRFTPEAVYARLVQQPLQGEPVTQSQYLDAGMKMGPRLYVPPQTNIRFEAFIKNGEYIEQEAQWYIVNRHISKNPMEFARLLTIRTGELMAFEDYARASEVAERISDLFEFHEGVIRGFAFKAFEARDFPPAIVALLHMYGESMLSDPEVLTNLRAAIGDNSRLGRLVAFHIAQESHETRRSG